MQRRSILPRILFFFRIGLCGAFWAVAAGAHSPPEFGDVRSALLLWTHGVINRDAPSLEEVLHEEFAARFAPDRAAYVRAVTSSTMPVTRIDLGHVRYEVTGDGKVRAAPVVLRIARGLNRVAYALTFVESAGRWWLRTIDLEVELPPGARPAEPPPGVRRTVPVRLRDAVTGEPLAARVHIEDAAGLYWPPPGHVRDVPTGWRQEIGGDVVLEGRTWAYVRGDFELLLPVGRYTLEAVRGIEYEPEKVSFQVSDANAVSGIEVRLERWADTAGWYSGDTHVHFLDPQTALLEIEGEGLHVVNLLATRWRELITGVEHFTGAPSGVSRPGRIVYVNEEARHGYLGHLILLGLEELVHPLTWGRVGVFGDGYVGGLDHPPLAHHADATHAQGGLVTWAHLPLPLGELAVDVALGKVDSVDLMTFGDAFAETEDPPGAARTWYRFLNCGFRLPATAGTDKMFNTQVVGAARTYVKIDGELDYEAWLEGIRAGRTFVTNGPILQLDVEGRGIGATLSLERAGRLRVVARVSSRQPVERLEIVVGGRVVEHVENPGKTQQLTLEARIGVAGNTWIAVRAHGGAEVASQGAPQQAHTSPVWVELAGESPLCDAEDVEVLLGWCDDAIEWARSEARFLDESQRRGMIELFTEARRVYLDRSPAP